MSGLNTVHSTTSMNVIVLTFYTFRLGSPQKKKKFTIGTLPYENNTTINYEFLYSCIYRINKTLKI